MGTTSEVSWGVLIATYVFFVAITSGLCLVSSLGHVFGFKVFEPIAKKALFLAFVTLIVGFSVIATELERPFLLLKLAILSPNPTAPIWWMGALYGTYTVIIAAELFFLMREDHPKARVVGIIGVVAAFAAHSNLGAVFGLSHARPFWFGPLRPAVPGGPVADGRHRGADHGRVPGGLLHPRRTGEARERGAAVGAAPAVRPSSSGWWRCSPSGASSTASTARTTTCTR